jgi:hypothetical protein
MTETQPNLQNPAQDTAQTATELLVKLRQKQGTWVEWGQAIAYLQKNGYNPQDIFEATGFEPIQQNQVIVGSQVYNSMEKSGSSPETLAYYSTKSSDVLYELRGLTQEDRATTADLTYEYKLDADLVRDIAKAIKDYSWFPSLPEGFSKHPGDAIAYQSWKYARQKSDLSERSRLIAKGLRFVHSETARKQLEQLLMDFSVAPKLAPPILPFYRLEIDEDLPRILPVVGELPLTPQELKAVPFITEIQPFRIVKFAGEQAWVSLPGWKVLLNAEDPVVVIGKSDIFPNPHQNKVEPIMIVIDRAQREWDISNYFVFENGDSIDFQWFETAPAIPLLGKMIVLVRPKKVLDEEYTKDAWQIDE